MVVTPSGADYTTLAVDDMPVVDLASGRWTGPKPSSERDLHRAVYLERREINGVIHMHSPNACTLAAARHELPPILDDIAQLLGPSVPRGRLRSAQHEENRAGDHEGTPWPHGSPHGQSWCDLSGPFAG